MFKVIGKFVAVTLIFESQKSPWKSVNRLSRGLLIKLTQIKTRELARSSMKFLF